MLKITQAITVDFVSGVWLDPQDPIEAERRAFTWTIKNINEDGIEIDIKFDQPLFISLGEEPDTLITNFMRNDLFMLPVVEGKEILPNGFSTPITLPPQMEKVADDIPKPEELTKLLLIFNFLLTFFFGLSASSLVGMINAL